MYTATPLYKHYFLQVKFKKKLKKKLKKIDLFNFLKAKINGNVFD